MRRRDLLACGAVCLSGCLGGTDAARIGRLVVGNFTPSPVTVDVVVLEGDAVRYEETFDVEADDDADDVMVPSVAVTDELPAEPGDYVVEYGFAGESRETFEFARRVSGDCGQIHLDVREPGRVELFYASSCDTVDAARENGRTSTGTGG